MKCKSPDPGFSGTRVDIHHIAMESLLVLFNDAPKVENPKAYLREIIKKKLLEYRRSASAQTYAIPMPALLAALERSRPRVDKRRIVLSIAFRTFLTPNLRAAARLHYFYGYSYFLIAQELGLSEGNARQRICRVEKILKENKLAIQHILRHRILAVTFRVLLAPNPRKIATLFYLDGSDLDQIAATLRIDIEAAQKRLQSVLATLASQKATINMICRRYQLASIEELVTPPATSEAEVQNL